MVITRSQSKDNQVSIYYKIIGENFGAYPYRLGLNTLKYNDEMFDPTPKCTAGGLYFCTLKNLPVYVGAYGDRLCIVSLPNNAQKVQLCKKCKADKIIIEKILPLSEVATWEYLIEQGLDINAADGRALVWTSAHGHLDAVKFLVEHGADIHVNSDWPVTVAARAGHLDVVKYLICLEFTDGRRRAANRDWALHMACQYGHLSIVKFLVEDGVDIHRSNDWAIQLASMKGHLDVVKFLVESGANIHAGGYTGEYLKSV